MDGENATPVTPQGDQATDAPVKEAANPAEGTDAPEASAKEAVA